MADDCKAKGAQQNGRAAPGNGWYSAALMKAARLSVALCLLSAPTPAVAQEAVYIVRHAERADQSADSRLSSDGIKRASSLSRMLADAGITHIFTSEARRTIDTASPLASAAHLTPRQLPAADVAALAAAVTALGPRDRALVVGHSNTVPELLRALHVDTPITIADSDFANLFIVLPQKNARPTLLRLKY
jgi:phosphohistidine phosphatase SixA